MRGLYWLSFELHDPNLKFSTSDDARELHDIRNALEHSFLKVTEGWAEPFYEHKSDDFAYTLGSKQLEAKAMRVMQIARSALFNLCFAIAHEEDARKASSQKLRSIPIDVQAKRANDKRRDSF